MGRRRMFDEPMPWWVQDAARGGFGGAAGIGVYKAVTGEGGGAPKVVLALLILTLVAWYMTAVARWRREHRVTRE